MTEVCRSICKRTSIPGRHFLARPNPKLMAVPRTRSLGGRKIRQLFQSRLAALLIERIRADQQGSRKPIGLFTCVCISCLDYAHHQFAFCLYDCLKARLRTPYEFALSLWILWHCAFMELRKIGYDQCGGLSSHQRLRVSLSLRNFSYSRRLLEELFVPWSDSPPIMTSPPKPG